jgi:thiopurine S-methyltransferase
MAAARLGGPLGDEIGATLDMQALGTPRRDAYRALADRVGSDDIARLVAALMQAEELGTPLAHALAGQADSLRAARRQMARDRAARAAPRIQLVVALVMVPGCGRGHEARLLAELGFSVVGVDSSGEALRQARELYGTQQPGLRWLQADLFDAEALAAGGLGPGSLAGVLEHTSFCAIDPSRRQDWLDTMARLLAPQGWLLGLFWCHGQSGGPPWGSDPASLAARLAQAGLACDHFQPARGSATSRDGTLREGEWLGQWHRASAPVLLEELPAASMTPPVVLTIGGSDSGGGAGIQADLKTFAALQVHGCSALTCVTAQNTLGVDRVDGLSAAALAAQIQAVCRDLPVRALKTGMLLNQELITTTAEQIAPLEAFRLCSLSRARTTARRALTCRTRWRWPGIRACGVCCFDTAGQVSGNWVVRSVRAVTLKPRSAMRLASNSRIYSLIRRGFAPRRCRRRAR